MIMSSHVANEDKSFLSHGVVASKYLRYLFAFGFIDFYFYKKKMCNYMTFSFFVSEYDHFLHIQCIF
jgi:hypothetical protein